MASMVRSNKMTRVSSEAKSSSSKPNAASSKAGVIVGGMSRPPDAHPGIPSNGGGPRGGGNSGSAPSPARTPTTEGFFRARGGVTADGEPIKPKGKF